MLTFVHGYLYRANAVIRKRLTGSSRGISALGDGLVQIGMSSKPLSESDRAKYPKVRIKPIHSGEDAVTLIVSKDVWKGGVRR